MAWAGGGLPLAVGVADDRPGPSLRFELVRDAYGQERVADVASRSSLLLLADNALERVEPSP